VSADPGSVERAQRDPATTRKSDFPVLRPTPLRWADLDTFGHVNNAVHYQLMDTAIMGWLGEATGVDVRRLPGFGVVVETSCRYFREISFTMSPIVGIALASIGRSSVRYDVGFFIDDDGPAALARFVHVYIDHETRRPVSVPPQIRSALSQFRLDGAETESPCQPL